MAVDFQVETGSLTDSSAALAGAGDWLRGAADRLHGIDGVDEPAVSGGLEALKTAWGAALIVLADDAALIAAGVRGGAEAYSDTDGQVRDSATVGPR
jgi:hypothetical protein